MYLTGSESNVASRSQLSSPSSKRNTKKGHTNPVLLTPGFPEETKMAVGNCCRNKNRNECCGTWLVWKPHWSHLGSGGQELAKGTWRSSGVRMGSVKEDRDRKKQQSSGRPQRSRPNRSGPSLHREGRPGWREAGNPADAPGDRCLPVQCLGPTIACCTTDGLFWVCV